MKYRVLCIEDDEIDRRLIERRISRIQMDVEPIFVDTIAAAIQETEKHCPDVVVLDWHLLDGEGQEYLDHVSVAFPWLPVIVLTSESDELATTTLKTGAQDFLTKGKFNDDQFERALLYSIGRAKVLGLKHLEQEATKREPIQRYTSQFVHDVRHPTRALAMKLDRLVDAIMYDEPVQIEAALLERAVLDIREHLDEILAVARDLSKQAREGHFEQPLPGEGEETGFVEEVELPTSERQPDLSSPFDVGRRLSILIIDNEHYMQLMFKRLLGQEHDLAFASTLAEVPGHLLEHAARFDGILCNFIRLDSQTKLLEGVLEDTFPELSSRVVLFASGALEPSFLDFLERSGARVLPKPFELEQLRSALVHWASLQPHMKGGASAPRA